VWFVFPDHARDGEAAFIQGAHVPAALFAAKLREMRSLAASKMLEEK